MVPSPNSLHSSVNLKSKLQAWASPFELVLHVDLCYCWIGVGCTFRRNCPTQQKIALCILKVFAYGTMDSQRLRYQQLRHESSTSVNEGGIARSGTCSSSESGLLSMARRTHCVSTAMRTQLVALVDKCALKPKYCLHCYWLLAVKVNYVAKETVTSQSIQPSMQILALFDIRHPIVSGIYLIIR